MPYCVDNQILSKSASISNGDTMSRLNEHWTYDVKPQQTSDILCHAMKVLEKHVVTTRFCRDQIIWGLLLEALNLSLEPFELDRYRLGKDSISIVNNLIFTFHINQGNFVPY